ncbi:MAG: hypothetical protein J7L55_03850 [Desulfurococcales archaeon]|nr:hypothetical protein [Desulfurococcales archaeon]
MLSRQELTAKTCFTVIARGPKNVADVVNAFKAFFTVCSRSKVKVEVTLSGGTYRTLIQLISPAREAETCSRLMQAVLSAELGEAAEVIKVECGDSPLGSRYRY